jgi:hypothetical protein
MGLVAAFVAIPGQRQGLSHIGKTRKGEDRRVQEESSEEEIKEYRSHEEGNGKKGGEFPVGREIVEVKHGATVIRAEVGHRNSDGSRYIAGSSIRAGAPSPVSYFN